MDYLCNAKIVEFPSSAMGEGLKGWCKSARCSDGSPTETIMLSFDMFLVTRPDVFPSKSPRSYALALL